MEKKVLKLKKEIITRLSNIQSFHGGGEDITGVRCTFGTNCLCESENQCNSGIQGMCEETVFTTKPVTVQNCGESGNCIHTSQINDHCIEIGKTDACAFTEKSCKTCLATNIK